MHHTMKTTILAVTVLTCFYAGSLIGAELPQPGSDAGQWGAKLNDFLLVEHNPDGTPRDLVTPQMYGAAGDGVTDDAASFASAMAAASSGGRTLYVPAGNYLLGSTVDVTTDLACARGALLIYTGSGACLQVRNKKELRLSHVQMDLSGAGAAAIGLDIAGCWQSEFSQVMIRMSTNAGTSQEGVRIASSATNYMPWGSYILNFYNLNLFNGKYGVRTLQTDGDSVGNTLISVFGGWVLGQSDAAFFLKHAYNTAVYNVATEGEYQVAPYRIENSTEVSVFLGEVWDISPVATVNSNSAYISFERAAGLSDENFTVGSSSVVRYVSANGIKFHPSGVDPNYSVAFDANYNYGKPLAIRVRGGGAEREMLRYSELNGLELDLYNQSLKATNAATAGALPSITSGIPMPAYAESLLRVKINGTDYVVPLLKAP